MAEENVQQALIEMDPPLEPGDGGTIEWMLPKRSMKQQLSAAMSEKGVLMAQLGMCKGRVDELSRYAGDLQVRLARAEARIDKLMGIEAK